MQVGWGIAWALKVASMAAHHRKTPTLKGIFESPRSWIMCGLPKVSYVLMSRPPPWIVPRARGWGLGRLHNKTLICEQFKPMFTINKSFISKITSATFPKSSLQESWVVSVATPVSIVRVGKPTPTCPKSLARPRWIEIFHNLCHLGPQCVPEPSWRRWISSDLWFRF